MIRVFSKEGCPGCVQAKNILSRHGYTFEEVRIDQDNAAREFLLAAGHRAVPQIYVDDKLLLEGGLAELKELTTKQLMLKIREVNGN